MNPIYESKNNATCIYPEEQTTAVLHDGHRYKLMGESHGQELSSDEKVADVMAAVGLVVAAIFTCGFIFIGMASPTFRNMIIRPFKELQAGAHINLHYVLQPPEQWQRDSVHPFIQELKSKIMNNDSIPEQMTAASCCISIQYNHGESNAKDIPFQERARVKRQFLFENDGSSPLTKAELIQKIDSLEKELATSIETGIDVATTGLGYGCVLLHQDSPDNEVKASYDSFYNSEEVSHISNANVNSVLQFVYINPENVLSDDKKQIRVTHGCITI